MASSSTQRSLPPGVVFEPTDEELVFGYLIHKVSGTAYTLEFDYYIRDIDIYEHEPSSLSSSAPDTGNKNMYFFTPLHGKGKNTKRQVPGGFWKKTGTIDSITGQDGETVAEKTSLAYHHSESEKGEWLMKEYKLADQESKTTPLALWLSTALQRAKAEIKSKESGI